MNLEKKDKPIVLKSGNNKIMIGSTLAFLIVIALVSTTKLWMPDNKTIMARNNDTMLNFMQMGITVPSSFSMDTELNIGEVYLNENLNITDLDKELSYSLSTSTGIAYPDNAMFIDRGTCIVDIDNVNKCTRKVLIQFTLPEDFYYLKLNVSQESDKTELIELDYRNFENQKLSEKQKGYLAKLDVVNAKIADIEKQKLPYMKEKEGLDKTIKAIENEMKVLETTISAITDEATLKDKKALLEVKTKELGELKVKLEKSDGFITDFNNKIAEFNVELEALK